jgi:hypothetical protein
MLCMVVSTTLRADSSSRSFVVSLRDAASSGAQNQMSTSSPL